MKLLHECTHDFTNSKLELFADFEKFILKVDYEPIFGADIEDGIVGEHTYSSIDELSEGYRIIAGKIFSFDSDLVFNNIDNEEESPIPNLKKWYKNETKSNELTELNADERFALRIIKKILAQTDVAKLDNLVLYWGDEGSNCVYINNSGLNGVSEAEEKKCIKNRGWLNGTLIGVYTVEISDIVEDFDGDNFRYMQEEVDEYIYKICAILEANKCFNLIQTAPDFKMYSVWHDEEDCVDFEKRNKYNIS